MMRFLILLFMLITSVSFSERNRAGQGTHKTTQKPPSITPGVYRCGSCWGGSLGAGYEIRNEDGELEVTVKIPELPGSDNYGFCQQVQRRDPRCFSDVPKHADGNYYVCATCHGVNSDGFYDIFQYTGRGVTHYKSLEFKKNGGYEECVSVRAKNTKCWDPPSKPSGPAPPAVAPTPIKPTPPPPPQVPVGCQGRTEAQCKQKNDCLWNSRGNACELNCSTFKRESDCKHRIECTWNSSFRCGGGSNCVQRKSPIDCRAFSEPEPCEYEGNHGCYCWWFGGANIGGRSSGMNCNFQDGFQ